MASKVAPTFSRIAAGTILVLGASGCVTVQSANDPPPSEPPTTLSSNIAPSTPTVSPAAASPASSPPPASVPTSADPPSWTDVVAEVRSGVARIDVVTCAGSGHGTGFLIDDDLIVTAAHVVADSAAITVVMEDRQQVGGQVLGINESAELALVRTTSDVSGHQFELADSGPPPWAPTWRHLVFPSTMGCR